MSLPFDVIIFKRCRTATCFRVWTIFRGDLEIKYPGWVIDAKRYDDIAVLLFIILLQWL